MQLGQPLNKPYLERLTQHLKDGAYSKSAMTKRMAVARRLLLYLQERVIAPEAATVADEQGLLDYKLKKYSERHGHRPNDASAWRWSHTSGIHMLLRLVQGNWPPVPAPATHREAFHVDLCNDYAQWLSTVRGLAPRTIPNRRAEAKRFLESLGERGGRDSL